MKKMRTVFILSCFIVLLMPLATNYSAAQGIESWNPQCAKLLKQYRSKPSHKAFAASNPNSGATGGQACGLVAGPRSKMDAEVNALKLCNSNHYGTCWVTHSE